MRRCKEAESTLESFCSPLKASPAGVTLRLAVFTVICPLRNLPSFKAISGYTGNDGRWGIADLTTGRVAERYSHFCFEEGTSNHAGWRAGVAAEIRKSYACLIIPIECAPFFCLFSIIKKVSRLNFITANLPKSPLAEVHGNRTHPGGF